MWKDSINRDQESERKKEIDFVRSTLKQNGYPDRNELWTKIAEVSTVFEFTVVKLQSTFTKKRIVGV